MSHRALYWIVGGCAVVLLVIMLATFDYSRSNNEAEAKANQLISKYQAAGLPTPADAKAVARVLGTDAAVICDANSGDLARGLVKLNLSVGGAFYTRPIRADRRVLQGVALIAETYCPDQLQKLQKLAKGQRFANLVRG
jgi:hypothetical protein